MWQHIIKNNSKTKRNFLLMAYIMASMTSLAFDYKVSINDKSFEEENFNFFVQKVVDARLNKQKPIGSLVPGFSLNTKTVGNDSLDYEMNALFARKSEIFNAATKVMMVINQLNLRYIKSADGKKTELEYTISIDYYLSGAKTYGLLYQQFFKYKINSKSADKMAKDLNKGFSETIKNALTDFKKQLKANKAVVRKEFNADTLMQFLASKPQQVVTNQNVKDGLYFSCKDLYLDNPGILGKYFLTDSTGLGQRPLIVSAPGCIMQRVYAIVRDKRIYLYIGGGNYKAALLGDDGKLFIQGVTSATLPVDVKGGSASIGVLITIPAVPALTKITPADSTAQQAIKQPQTNSLTPDIIVDLETGDLVSIIP